MKDLRTAAPCFVYDEQVIRVDVIADEVAMNKAEIGDLVEISNAGSYAFTLSPQLFSSHDMPRQILRTLAGDWIEE